MLPLYMIFRYLHSTSIPFGPDRSSAADTATPSLWRPKTWTGIVSPSKKKERTSNRPFLHALPEFGGWETAACPFSSGRPPDRGRWGSS